VFNKYLRKLIKNPKIGMRVNEGGEAKAYFGVEKRLFLVTQNVGRRAPICPRVSTCRHAPVCAHRRAPISSRDVAFGAFAALVALVTAVACGPEAKKKLAEAIVSECVLPENQANSLQGQWANLPIKVSFKDGEWSDGQISEISAGASIWNGFFLLSKGFSVFDAGHRSTVSQTAPSCAGGTLSDGTVLYKRASSWTKSGSAIAVTTTCFTTSNSGGLAKIYNAIMEFNYVSFFTTAPGRLPDLQSIAVHELGHLMGLDHSCGALGRPNSNKANVACPDPNANPDDPIVKSAMFRNVLFDGSGVGEVKRTLNDNDMGRANCLYK
jgi:hypothetical protein